MKHPILKTVFIAASILAAMGYTGLAMAYYSVGIPPAQPLVFDPAGNNANSTDLATITCASGTDHLAAAIQDLSSPVPGLFVSLHIFKENVPSNIHTYMVTVTDQVSGDGGWSNIAFVYGGPGTYYLSIVKTNAGERNFALAWDCWDVNNQSMGMTDAKVFQFQ